MASQFRLPPVSSNLLPVLRYSSQFKFPLTAKEVWFWQIKSNLSPARVKAELDTLVARQKISLYSGFYSPKPGSQWVVDRQKKTGWNRLKWQKVRRLIPTLSRIPFVEAVFVTGALAVGNASRYDDIDLMVVTSSHTLWITRAFFVVLFKILRLRRSPGLKTHASPLVSDKICDNLWLDVRHLNQPVHSLYIAHEILQARPLMDKNGIHRSLLVRNSWVNDYLPVAYTRTLHSTQNLAAFHSRREIWFLAPFNLLFWLFQSIYMFSRRTTEKMGYGFAYFHPYSFKEY